MLKQKSCLGKKLFSISFGTAINLPLYLHPQPFPIDDEFYSFVPIGAVYIL